MKYELTRMVLEECRVLSLSEEDFSRASHARKVLVECLIAEERFNILVENYAEFEAELLNLALKDMLFQLGGWSDRIDELYLLNRRVANLLTMCRIFIDHTPQTLNDIFGANSREAERFKEATRHEYDEHLGYRALETLRNYVQHRALPIHRITNHGQWREDRSALEHWVIPKLDVSQIREIGGFRQAVLDELSHLPRPVDLRPLLREYMTCLRRLQGVVRELTLPASEAADQVINDFVAMWSEDMASPDLVGLELVARPENGEICERVPVMREIGERRRYLTARNRLAGDLLRQVITNKLA